MQDANPQNLMHFPSASDRYRGAGPERFPRFLYHSGYNGAKTGKLKNVFLSSRLNYGILYYNPCWMNNCGFVLCSNFFAPRFVPYLPVLSQPGCNRRVLHPE